MEHENHFVKEDLIEFEVEGGKFKFKPVDGGDELDWADEYVEVVDGKIKQNIKKLTECKLRNLVEVPYSRELISKVIKIDKEWKDLNKEERIKLLRRLEPTLLTKIINKINQIGLPSSEGKKNNT